MKKIVMIALYSLWVYAHQVNVATAANMGFVLPKLIEVFQKRYPNVTIETFIGGSGKLRSQIENGAPFDIFLSANTAYPEALYDKGLSIGKPIVYAKGKLLFLSPKGYQNDSRLQMLLLPLYRKVALANPKTAPYGTASIEALRNAGIYEAVRSKLVYGESIAQTVAYTLQAADGGFIAASALFSPRLKKYKEAKLYQEVDPRLYTPISQAMVLLKHAQMNKDAEAFFRFMQSDEAKAILQSYGYRIP